MILVITGYYLPFRRLFSEMDTIAAKSKEKIIIQGHAGAHKFSNCEHHDEISNLKEFINQADLVVTHGAMSMVEVIELNKPLVVVPRQKKHKEHINDHQVEFSFWLKENYKFPVVLEISELEQAIEDARKTKPIAHKLGDRNQLEKFLHEACQTVK